MTCIGLSVGILGGCSLFGEDLPNAEPGGLLKTNQNQYDAEVVRQGYERVIVDIPYVTRNATSDAIALIGCKRSPPPILQKRVEGEWQTAHAPVVLLCLSPPWTIRPGEMRRDTFRISAALPGQNIHPVFKSEEIQGTYRLVRRIYAGVSEGGTGEELLPLEKRVSNTFQLE